MKLTLTIASCPYCGFKGDPKNIVHRLTYQSTHLSQPDVEDFHGWVTLCSSCGVYFVNPRYKTTEFAHLYKDLSRKGKGSSVVKRIASWPMNFIMGNYHCPSLVRRLPARCLFYLLDCYLFMPLSANRLEEGMNVLDVGCGDGFHLRTIAPYGVNLYATEVHAGYEDLLSSGPEKIRYWIQDFTSIDWEKETGDEVFDLIIFHSVFYRLNAPSEALNLAWKLLRPGGTILRIEPFCYDAYSLRIATNFNFPQGFCLIHDIDKYMARIAQFYPNAEFTWKIYYGWPKKLREGKELTPITVLSEICRRTIMQVIQREPAYVKLEMSKPLHT